ncbi:hypothetical protein ACFFMN_09110 [Planobispora siamensis]|uniref:Uncharacterized protein n=1 Tax=Planobispora siamensis TaxID=936338 RepID=A0A8J3SDI0_9ACTN|nr:hypothetical protein [Planobispora siamensis]GIH91140.1 hypothetical protein Psi01_17700 [Planobispora siamensis]
MPISRSDLHDLLEERSRPAGEHPVPWESLRSRIRAARRRRVTAAVVAVALAVTAAVSGGLLLRHDPGDEVQIVTPLPDEPPGDTRLPARFTQSDGTVYRRAATAKIDFPRERSVTFEVELHGRPLALVVDCPGTRAGNPFPVVTVRVPGTAKPFTMFPGISAVPMCGVASPVNVMPLPADARRATFVIKMNVMEGTESAKGRLRPGAWRFGVYEWAPHTPMRASAPAPEPPMTFGTGDERFELVDSRTVTWPASREATLTFPNPGRPLAIVTSCGGDLSGGVVKEVGVGARTLRGSCLRPQERVGGYTYFPSPKGTGRVTVRVRLRAIITEYLRRPGTLTVAVYAQRRG